MKLLLLTSLVGLTVAIPFIGTEQSVSVTGKLTCNGAPAENVKVKLYESEIGESTLFMLQNNNNNNYL